MCRVIESGSRLAATSLFVTRSKSYVTFFLFYFFKKNFIKKKQTAFFALSAPHLVPRALVFHANTNSNLSFGVAGTGLLGRKSYLNS